MSDRPAADEVEVSVFGPGYGESAVLHLGNGDWAVVDSCVRPGTATPAAIQYLDELGVDISAQVVVVAATHWDDDHVRGFSEVVRASREATIVFSEVVRTEEFMVLAAVSPLTMAKTSGATELAKTLDILQNEGRNFVTARAGLHLWNDSSGSVTMAALSPSQRCIERAREWLAASLPDKLQPLLRTRSTEHGNDASIVISVEIDGEVILLGGDLEEKGVKGWSDVVEGHWPHEGAASVFKVPHHGSSDAHHPQVYDDLLTEDAISVIAPWRRGKGRLPLASDLDRICALKPSSYLTADPGGTGQLTPFRGAVGKMIQQTTLSRQAVHPGFGHVRLRKILGSSDWEVQLDGAALLAC